LSGFTYAREGHPNAAVLAEKIDWLEGATGGIITGSGMAAVSAVFLGIFSAGDHVLAGDQLYGRSTRLLTQDLPRMGFHTDLVDATNATALEQAIRPETKMIFVEVVTNPTLRVADMKAIVAMARKHNLLLVVDNTFTTPRGFRPLDQGADIVLHSITKLLAGHSDVTLGYVVAKDEPLNQSIRDAVVTWGLTPSPWDCWLAERGLHSFDLRFERVQKNAVALADFLADQAGVELVLYPGRVDHPDHERACSLLGSNFGNIVSFRLAGGRAAANAFTLAAPQLAFAPTLGDVGTTISHPASSSHRALCPDEREALGMTEGFFRVSVGIEDVELLKREFGIAIEAAQKAADV
jgi:cystathionine gamma-synthase